MTSKSRGSFLIQSMSNAKAMQRNEIVLSESSEYEYVSSDDEEDEVSIYDRLTAISSAEGKIMKNPRQVLRRRDSAGEAADALKKDLEDMGYDLECNSFITKRATSAERNQERYPPPTSSSSKDASNFSGNGSSMSSSSSSKVANDAILAMRSMKSPSSSPTKSVRSTASPTKSVKSSNLSGLADDDLMNPPRFDANEVFDDWKVEDDWDAHCVVPRQPSKPPPDQQERTAVVKAQEKIALIKERLRKKRGSPTEELDIDEETDDEGLDGVEIPPIMRKLSGKASSQVHEATSSPCKLESSSTQEEEEKEEKEEGPPMIIEGLSFVKSEESISPRAKRARSKIRLLVETRQRQMEESKSDACSAKTAPAKAMSTPYAEKTFLVKAPSKGSGGRSRCSKPSPLEDVAENSFEETGSLDAGELTQTPVEDTNGNRYSCKELSITQNLLVSESNKDSDKKGKARATKTVPATTRPVGGESPEQSPVPSALHGNNSPVLKATGSKSPKKKLFTKFSLFNKKEKSACKKETSKNEPRQEKKLKQRVEKTEVHAHRPKAKSNPKVGEVIEKSAQKAEQIASEENGSSVTKGLAGIASSHVNRQAAPSNLFDEDTKSNGEEGEQISQKGTHGAPMDAYVDYEIETVEGVEVVNLGKTMHVSKPEVLEEEGAQKERHSELQKEQTLVEGSIKILSVAPAVSEDAPSAAAHGVAGSTSDAPAQVSAVARYVPTNLLQTSGVVHDQESRESTAALLSSAWENLGKVLVGSPRNTAKKTQLKKIEHRELDSTAETPVTRGGRKIDSEGHPDGTKQAKQSTPRLTPRQTPKQGTFFPSGSDQCVETARPPPAPEGGRKPSRSVSPTKLLRKNLRNGLQKLRAMKQSGAAVESNAEKPNPRDPRDPIQDFLDSKLIGQEEHSYPSKVVNGAKDADQHRTVLGDVPQHLILNHSKQPKQDRRDSTIPTTPSRLDAKIWDEIADASLVVEEAMKKLGPPQTKAPNDIPHVLSDEIEHALLTLKKHADRFGITESDLLLAVKSQDDSHSKGETTMESEVSAVTATTMTVGQEILDIFKAYFSK